MPTAQGVTDVFRAISVFAAAVCAALFLLLLLDPGRYVETYGVASDAGAVFMGRRASPMFLGLAVTLWLARNAPQSALRMAVCYGVAATFLGIAATGLFEFARGQATGLIAIAAAAEMAIAAVFLVAART
jgi:hypothetical protein